ncbi:MAG: DMT family transporter [Halanaeroarchaeum sp.]
MSPERRGVALAILSAAGFGTLAIFGRVAEAAGLSIPTLLAYRFTLAVPMVWGYLGWRGRLRVLHGRRLGVALALGALGYAAMSGLFLWGVSLLNAGLAGILLYTYPAMVVVIAAAVLDERVTVRTVAAVVVAMAGVALVSGAQPRWIDPLGIAVLLAAAVVYASYISVSRVVLDQVDAAVLTAHVIPAAGASFVAYGAVRGTLSLPTTVAQWGIVVGVAALATAIPILAFFSAVALIGASRTSVVSTFEPVFTVALGVAILGEPLTVATVVGGAAVVAGVLLVQSREAGGDA